MSDLSVFWFRRDLRLDDNAGLYHALKSGHPVLPIFIFDTNILDDLKDKYDKRVDFIHQQLEKIQETLTSLGSTLIIINDTPLKAFKQLINKYDIAAVYTNHDYEPYAQTRDKKVQEFLLKKKISFHTFKDQVVFEKEEVLKSNGEPYTVYTPYSKQWKEKLNSFYLKPYPTEKYFDKLYKHSPNPIPTLKEIGFNNTGTLFPATDLDESIAEHYKDTRDIPSIKGTTRLSIHLRFGTISIRKLVTQTKAISEKLLNELIWREFYQMILWHFPYVVSCSFKKAYDEIIWRNNEDEYKAWCEGKTGYPIIDAGMRELNETGYMHNRVRMIVASFLTKDLLIDWRWGEAYFAEKLLDYDLASNNGGWQWAAGSGCDAAPYFRVFNPYLQTKKFDPELKYIRKWVPEFEELTYTQPIVDHNEARKRCLATYKNVLNNKTKSTG